MSAKNTFNLRYFKSLAPFLGAIMMFFVISNMAIAQEINDINENIVQSISDLPGFITGISYLIGIFFAVQGIIKTKEHVENPNQTALRYPLISFLIGGTMFALPIIYDSMQTLIEGDAQTQFNRSTEASVAISGLAGTVAQNAPVQVFGSILGNIINSVENVPGFVTAMAYILGLIAGVAGLLKIKEHVEEPSRTPMKEGIIRLIIGGMLFAIPSIYSAVYNAVSSGGGLLGAFAQAQMVLTTTGTTLEGGSCFGQIGGTTLGGAICRLFVSTTPMTAFLTAIAYLFGLFVGLWGIFKIQEHVLNPQQVPIWDPVAKLAVAGGLFALPNIVTVLFNTVSAAIFPHSNALNGQARPAAGPAGLDTMIAALVNDTFVPMMAIINWLGLVAGFILIFIGITRLMKSAQEGARGPGGLGTIMTFVAGGALASFSPIVASLSGSLFGADGIRTGNQGTLNYTAGMDGNAIDRAHTVIDSIVLFVAILGTISIMRGIFIVRGVSEGNSQASMMAGVTHLIGGAVAVNLGPVINLVQATLGIDPGLGVSFGGGGGGLLTAAANALGF